MLLLRWSAAAAIVVPCLLWFLAGNAARPGFALAEGAGPALIALTGVAIWYALAFQLLWLFRPLRKDLARRARWAAGCSAAALAVSIAGPPLVALPGLVIAGVAGNLRLAGWFPDADRCRPGTWDPDDEVGAEARVAIWGGLAPDGRAVVVTERRERGALFKDGWTDLSVVGFLPDGRVDPALAKGGLGCLMGDDVDAIGLAGDRVLFLKGGSLAAWVGLDGKPSVPAEVAAANAALTALGPPVERFRGAQPGHVLHWRPGGGFTLVDLSGPPRAVRSLAPAPGALRFAAEMGERIAVAMEGGDDVTSLDELGRQLVAVDDREARRLVFASPLGLAPEIAGRPLTITGLVPLDGARVLVVVEARGGGRASTFALAAADPGSGGALGLELEPGGTIASARRVRDGRVALLLRPSADVLFVPDSGRHRLEPPREPFSTTGSVRRWDEVTSCITVSDPLAASGDGTFLSVTLSGPSISGPDCQERAALPTVLSASRFGLEREPRVRHLWP